MEQPKRLFRPDQFLDQPVDDGQPLRVWLFENVGECVGLPRGLLDQFEQAVGLLILHPQTAGPAGVVRQPGEDSVADTVCVSEVSRLAGQLRVLIAGRLQMFTSSDGRLGVAGENEVRPVATALVRRGQFFPEPEGHLLGVRILAPGAGEPGTALGCDLDLHRELNQLRVSPRRQESLEDSQQVRLDRADFSVLDQPKQCFGTIQGILVRWLLSKQVMDQRIAKRRALDFGVRAGQRAPLIDRLRVVPDASELSRGDFLPRIAQGRPGGERERHARRLDRPDRGLELIAELLELEPNGLGDSAGDAGDLLAAKQQIQILPPKVGALVSGAGFISCRRSRRIQFSRS